MYKIDRNGDSNELYLFYKINKSLWKDFNPLITDKSLNFCRKLASRLDIDNIDISEINIEKKNLRKIKNTNNPIDTINDLLNNKQFVEKHPTIVNKIKELKTKEDYYFLYNNYSTILRTYVSDSSKKKDDDLTIYNNFSSIDIYDYIQANKFIKKCYKSENNGINWTLNIHYIGVLDKGLEYSLLRRIIFMLTLCDKDRDIKIKPITVDIWLCEIKKQIYKSQGLNENEKVLGIMNINSGCCVKTPTFIGDISIWRREEVEKVLVHELIHALYFDFFRYNKSIDISIDTYFDISTIDNINLFEAYTETWTNIFSNIFYMILYRKNVCKLILNHLKYEAKLSIFQIAKILVYYGYSEFSNCVFYCKQGYTQKTYKFKQNTSILSYYVFKGSLLYNLDKFIDFMTENNGSNTPYIFKGDVRNFYNLIIECIDNESFIKSIDNCIQYINNNVCTSLITSNLRMTCNEFCYRKL